MATYSDSQPHKLIACTQTLFHLSFSLRRRSMNPPRFFLLRALDGLRRENRGSVNRPTNSHIHTLFKEYGRKSRTWKLRNIFNEIRYKANCYQYNEEKRTL